MTVASGDTERHVIPRWRSLSQTLTTGEFATGPSTPLSVEEEEELSAARDEWLTNRGESRASEFVAAALVLGVPDRASDAAEYLGRSGSSQGSRVLANAAVAHRDPAQIELLSVAGAGDDGLIIEIAQLKQLTRRDPRNAVAWLDLARLYTTVGLAERAGQAMTIATHLAPTNRYIVRSAVAFYSHIGDEDRGHLLVRRHPAVQRDPWLLAADLAVTAEAQRRQVHVRQARTMIESGRFSPLAVSELASELGSMEVAAASKRARRLFALAMKDPTENAAAQAEWASREQPRLRTWDDSVSQPGEPAARHAERLRDWPAATKHGEFWLNDQPFSDEAACFASYAAAMGEDYVRGAHLADVGLRANPDSVILNNNLAYSLVELGDLKRARETLERLSMNDASDVERAVVFATTGLLEMRMGDREAGVALYQRAIDSARAAKNEGVEAQAWLMLARELLASGPDDGGSVRKAVAVSRMRSEPGIQELLERLLRRLPRQ